MEIARGTRQKWVVAKAFLALFLALTSICLGLFSSGVNAVTAPPSIITYQGKLLYNDLSVTTTQSIAFILYDSLTGGTAVYTAAGTLPSTSTISVTPSNGLFSVDLGGSGTNTLTSDVFRDNASVYLEVVVGGQALTPRKRITSAPYALNSSFLNGLSATSTPTTSAYIPATDANGNLSLSGNAQSTAVSGGVIYINPVSTTSGYTLFGISDNGTQRFRVNKEGNTAVAGNLAVGATSTLPNEYDTTYKFYVNGTSVLGSNSLVYGNLNLQAAPSAPSMDPPPERLPGSTLSASYNLTLTGKIISGSAGYYLYGGGFGDGYNLFIDSNSSAGTINMKSLPLSINSSSTLSLNTADNTPIITGTGLFTSGGALYASSTLSIGTSTSEFNLTMDNDGGIIARGTFGSGDTLTTAGLGARLIWYPRKAAFRAGSVDATEWDDANIGSLSASLGSNTIASGVGAFSFGTDNEASGSRSLAGGNESMATGDFSFAFGEYVTSTELHGVAFGYGYTNSNSYSLSVGNGAVDNLISAVDNSWLNLNNGNVGIGTSTPSGKLTVVGTSHLTGTTTITNTLDLQGKAGSPIHVGSIINGAGGAILDGPGDIFVSGNFAYITVSASDTLEIVDVSDPSNPTHKAYLTNGTGGALLDGPASIYISGNYAYIAARLSNALEIVDISDPSNPTHKGSIANGAGGALLESPVAVYVSGNYAYVGSQLSNALEIVDISDPSSPIHRGSIVNGSGGALLDSPNTVFVSGRYAYITSSGSDSFEIVDVSDPSNPTHKGSIINGAGGALLGIPSSMFISGKYAYVGSASDALEIIDISNPASPVHKGSLSNGVGGALLDNPVDVHLSGKYLYVASLNNDALEIVDVSNPASPTHKGSIVGGTGGALLDGLDALFVSGNYAYLSSGFSDAFEIIDVTGASITQAEIGTTKTTNLQVMSNALFDQGVDIRGGVSIGASGLLLSGNFGMSAPTTTNNITATNTLSFSHTALFKSSATTSESNLFIFDTTNQFTTANSSTAFLLSVRNNGTSKFSVASNGDVAAAGIFYAASINVGSPSSPGDLAERVDIAQDDTVEPGDVLMVDPISGDTYRRTSSQYEQAVAGVVSTNPTIIVGNGKTDYTAVLAMIGRVPVKASDENGAIQRGDLLVSATRPGYAMKYDASKDDNKMVGIVGIALEPLFSGTGKIMSLIRTGWANSYNQSIGTLRQNIEDLASAQGVNINTNPANLNVDNQSGQLVYTGGNLNMQGNIILNVASIAGKNDRWLIDSNGHFITRVDTTNGKKEMFSIQSPTSEFVFSSSSQLINGEAKISFDDITAEIIDIGQPLKVSVTLTSGEAKGIYVSEKNGAGFVVKELGGGTSNASFDWMVVAKRREGTMTQNDPLSVAPVEPAVSNGSPILNNDDQAPPQILASTSTDSGDNLVTSTADNSDDSTNATNNNLESTAPVTPIIPTVPIVEPALEPTPEVENAVTEPDLVLIPVESQGQTNP